MLAGRWLEWVTPIDPCIPTSINYHVICITGADNKAKALKAAGLWFMDDEATANCTESPFIDLRRPTLGVSTRRILSHQDGWKGREGPGGEGSGFEIEFAGPRGGAAPAPQAAGQPPDSALARHGGGAAPAGAASGAMRAAQLPLEAHPAAGPGQRALKQQGPRDGGAGGNGAKAGAARALAPVPRCMPSWWRRPRQESAFLRCDRRQLAFVFYPQLD